MITQLGVDAPAVRPTVLNPAKSAGFSWVSSSIWNAGTPLFLAVSYRRLVLPLSLPPTTTIASTFSASSLTSSWRRFVESQRVSTASSSAPGYRRTISSRIAENISWLKVVCATTRTRSASGSDETSSGLPTTTPFPSV